MTTFLALYRGKTIASAKLIATTVDPVLCGIVAEQLLGERLAHGGDPVLGSLARGRRAALRLIQREATRVDVDDPLA